MNYLDAVYYAKGIGRRKEEPQQPEKEEKESNIILDALDSATRFAPPRIAYDIATSAVTPLLGGTIAETAGNALQALGDPDRTLAARYSPNMQKLRDMGDYTQEIADDLLQAGLDKVKPADNDTYSGALKNAFQRGAYGVLQGDASMIRSDKSANALAQAIKQLQDENPIEAELSLDYLTSPHGMTRDFGQVTGSMAAILPAMLAMPESVAARGAAKLGGDALTRYLINQGRYGAAKQFARRAPEIFRYSTTSAPAEGIAEGGHVRADALAQGLSEEEATQRSIDTMLANTALLTGTNTLEGFLLGAPNIASSLGRKAMQGLARGGLNMGVQGTEEALQKAISNANTDKPYGIAPQNWTPDQWQEFKAAFGGTAPMALVAGAGHMASRPNTNEQNWNRGSQRDISNEDYSARAEKAKGANGIDNFMRAIIQQESGGNYNEINSDSGATGAFQIMPENWSAWAQDAGLSADAPMTPENQDLVARNKMQEYYNKFGNWRDVAIAWYGGEGAVSYSEEAKNRPQGEYPSINEYADSVMSRFEKVGGDVSREGIHYLGDNGKGEGNTWQRQNDNVSLDGMQPDLLNAIDVLGKWFYDRTGKRLVVTAGTNGKHADGEHSHAAGWKVDVNDWDGESDGYLVTADGSKGSLTDEFIKFGQSIGLGMNWEGDHIDVALDGTQWDGSTKTTNFGGFKLWRESPKRQATQPSQQEESSQQAPPKPLFDINREDNQAQDIFKQFAEEKALNSNTNEKINFFDGMFDADGIFQNTKENRDAIRKDYADEFISFAQNTIPAEQPQQTQPTQPAPIQSPKVQAQPKIKEQKIDTTPENPLLNNDNLKDVMVNYLNGIDKNLPENTDFALEIGKAWGDGKYEKVEQMLESRGISTTPNQSDPVTQNKPPENVLPKFKAKLSGQEKLINTATKAVPVGNSRITARKKQGKALTELATQNNIEIPQPEIIALRNGSTKAVQKWRDELLKSGLFNAPQAQVQETPQQENSQMRTPQENSTSAKILQARKARTEQENKATAIASRLLNMSEADESFVKRESPKQSKTPYESWEDLSELSREHDITGTSYEKELQQRQAEEERQRQWKAKQDRELAELKARQAENKRLAEVRRKMDEGKIAQREAEEKQQQIENVQPTETQEPTPQEQEQPLTQEEIDKRLSQLGQISQEEADEYLNGITKQVQPQSQSQAQQGFEKQQQAPEENSAPQVQEQPQKGKTAEVLTDNRAKYPVTYKVIEAEDLNASHSIDETGNVVTNGKFPAELQPRDRNRAGYRDTVLNRANNLDPEQLGESENVNQGAPVTRNDGVVLNGNGRVMAIRRAYETGKGDNYKNSLIQNAEKYGLNSEKIAAMKNPVLVRELGENLSAEDTENIIGSKQGGEKLSPREQAKADAQKISTALLAKAPQNGDLSSNDGLQFVADVINTITTPEEKNSLMTSDGTVSDAAVTRVKDALFTMAYGDNEFVDNLTESAYSDTSKTITTAMRNAAPKIAQARARMRNGEINQADLSPITNAAKTIKSDTVVLKDLITPTLAGFDSRSNEEKDILGFFNAHKSNPNEITKFLNSIADNLLNNKKGGMFEDTAQTNSLANAIANARQQVEGQEIDQQHLQNQAMRNQIAAQLHSNLKTKNNPSLKAQINGLIKDAAQGDNEALRIINRIKGNAPSENNLFAGNSTPSKSDKNLDAKAKNFFEKFERQDNQGKPLIGATLKFSAFPTPEDVEKSAPITDGVDGIAKKYSGRYGGDVGYGWSYHFKTTEDRDNFIRSVMNSGVLETEIDRQQKAIQSRVNAENERKNKIEKIIDGAKEKAYEILEADKYPEIKSWLNRQIENGIRKKPLNTLEGAEDFAKRIVSTVRSYKDAGHLANDVLLELWRDKYGAPSRIERKYKAKFDTVAKIIKQVEDGKLPLEKAYEDVKHFLETGRRKKETANPKSKKVETQSEKQLPQTTEEKFSIRQWNANKAILKNALEKSKGLPRDRKEYFSFLLKLADMFEHNHPTSDKSWQNGEKLRDTSTGIQVNVERIVGYNKEERGSDDVRGWLNAATFNLQGDVHYTGTHDLDKLSASPYGIAKLIERAIKYSHSHIDSKTLPTDAKNYFDLYQEDIRKQSEIASKQNSTESEIENLKAQLEAAKENVKNNKEKLKRWQKEEDPETRERWVTFHNKEAKYWQDKVQALEKQLDELHGTKHSKQGKDVDTTIKNYVDQKDLTPQQKLLQDFGRKLGVRVIFFKGDSRFHGQHSNGITYLNVDSNMPLGKVFWHESMHWLKANNSKLYQQLAKAVGITNEQRQAYLDRTERNDLDTDEAIDEEIIADQFEDVAKRSGLLQSISGKNRGLIERVIQWLQDTMKKFVEHFRNPQGKLTTAQAQALTDEFGKLANGLVDSNSEQIFRYNRRTHNIELADGRDWNSSVEHSDNRGAFSLQPKYSIDASDNSNESTLQRIRNKISAFIGSSDAPSKRRNKRITQFLEKLADIRILTGHIKGAKNIDVDEFHRLLKSKKAYDWENILPEIGGMLAKSLNLNDSQEMRNYFTDWLLTGAPNNNSAEAKEFQQAARNNPAMFEILQNIRNEFDEIQNLSAEEFYGEKIIDKPPEKTLAEHLGYYKDNWKEEFIDDLHPINRMFEQVVAKAEKTNPKLAKWLKETVNPYEMARLFRGIDSVAEIMIGKIGTSPSERINEIRANLAQAFPNVNFSRFKPIAMILEEVGALNDKKTRRAFESYCVAKLDKEMHEKKKGDPEKYGYLQPLGTEEQADAMIAKYEKQFGQAQKDLVLYSNTMLTIMYDAGVLTKNKYSEILHSWKNYIPTARVFDENEEYDFVNSFKQKTGSNRDVWSPLQKMIANTNSLIKQAERNKIKCQIAQLARCGQFGQIIAETDNPHPNTGTAVSFYEFGKKHWLETPDTSLVRALSAIQSQKDGAWIVKAFNAVMSVFKSMMTNRNLDFAAGNVFRDSAAAYIHNKHLGYANPFMFFADVARIGFKGFWKKDANWIEWKAMGGAQSSYVSEDVDYVQRSISDITESGLESFKKRPLSYLLDRLQYIAEASETATRLTTYVKARDALAAQRSDGKATLDDKRHAALASRNATIDFAKAGTSTRKANRVFAFANAAVQDFALQAQTFSPAKIQKAMKGDKQAQQQIFSAGFRLLAMGVIPTLIQFALMHRDDDKKKIYRDLHDWEKETYWYFGDLVHIPKSMDIGIRLTSAITDEFLKTAIDKDPVEWRRFRRLILDAAPGLTATLFTPLIETYANYSLFRDAPIVPSKEQHLPGHLQYGYDTSSVAKIISDNTISIAKIFGAETGFSPRNIDYLINGYLGFMGRFVSHIPNYAGRGGISLDEIPIARRFLYEPYKNPKIVKDYYEALDEQSSLYNGYKLELQQGKKVKPPEDFDPALYQRLRVAQESMRKLSNLEKRIQEDKKLSDNQRKEKLRELELRRVALCEKVFNKAR